MTVQLTRRRLIGTAGALGALSFLPGMAFAAAATTKRFVFVIQRGAADGLSLVPPVGDKALMGLRAALVEPDAIRLDGFFALHPALAKTAALFSSGQARAYHAIATAYRDRSHFDGQNVLESGGSHPYAMTTGWIGRLLPMLPRSDASALALAPAVPLALRGTQPVATYLPNHLPQVSDDLLLRVSDLYHADRQLQPLWAEAMKTRQLAGDIGGNGGKNGQDLGRLAASLLAPADGARVMMIETGGWDTHSAQMPRLKAQLRGLDSLLSELQAGLGPAWSDTLVLVATEFGRTAAINGTAGTDHGTASVAFLLGGGLAAGKPVEADWPGLAPSQLYQNRDLKPTTALSYVVEAALARHYALDADRLRGLFACSRDDALNPRGPAPHRGRAGGRNGPACRIRARGRTSARCPVRTPRRRRWGISPWPRRTTRSRASARPDRAPGRRAPDCAPPAALRYPARLAGLR